MQTFVKNILKRSYLWVIFPLIFLTGCSKSTLRSKNSSTLGAHYFTQGDFEKSIEYYEKALNDNPQNKDSLTMLGWSYFKQGQYDAAIASFEKLVAVDPKALDAYTGRGWSNFKKGNSDQAIWFFEEAIKLDPHSVDPYDGIGWSSFKKGDLAKAEEYFNLALHKGMKFQPGSKIKADPEAHRGLGYLYFSKNDFKTALKHFKMASLLQPDWNDARTKWGECLFSMGKYVNALRVYRHSLRYAKTAEAYNKMGWSYFHLTETQGTPYMKDRRYHRAKKMFNKALAINPEYADSLSGLSEVEARITYNQ